MGIAAVGFFTGMSTLLHTRVEDRYRGRVFGAYGASGTMSTVAGLGLTAAIGDIVDVLVLFNVVGTLYIVCAVVARTMLHGDAAEIGLATAEAQETPAPL